VRIRVWVGCLGICHRAISVVRLFLKISGWGYSRDAYSSYIKQAIYTSICDSHMHIPLRLCSKVE
jgi:hypothetical protein